MRLSLSHVQLLASKIRNWQKFICKMFHLQIRNSFFFFFLAVYCLFYLMMKVYSSFHTLIISSLSTQSSGAEIERILCCSFHSTDLKWWPDQVSLAAWLSTVMPSKVRTQNQKCGTSGNHNPELCSVTFTCLCDLWISISSNELAVTRQKPHLF